MEQYINNLGPFLKSQVFSLNKESNVHCFLTENNQTFTLIFVSNTKDLVLHWGVGLKSHHDWISPLSLEIFQNLPDSVNFDQKAAQTKFYELSQGLHILEIPIRKALLPKQLNFVFKKGNSWFNNNGKNYSFAFNQGNQPQNNAQINNNNQILSNEKNMDKYPLDSDLSNMVSRIIEIESSKNSWTLMHRFNLCNEFIKQFGHESPQFLSWIYVWMRYSGLGKLTWQRNYNTRPSEMAHSQKNLSINLTSMLLKASKNGIVSNFLLISLILGTFGKGGDNGQRIRDQILEIMHRNHIQEHNNFYEQWHQKLHNNTTPDDVGICEAVIAFNKSNQIEKYWETLQKFGISKDRLASFERPIVMEPFYAPQLVGDLTIYLDTLQSIHSGGNLLLNIKAASNYLVPEGRKLLTDIATLFNDFDKIKQIERVLAVRQLILQSLGGRSIHEDREVVYLEMSLQAYVRQITESIIHLDIPVIYLLKLMTLLLEHFSLTCSFNELELTKADWKFFVKNYKKTFDSNKEHALIIKSSVDRIKRFLGRSIDLFTDLLDGKAKYMGSALNLEPKTIELFTEETIRNSFFFALSLVTKKLDCLFKKIGISSGCNIISNYPNKVGRLLIFPSISSANPKYDEPTILVVKKLSGEEEIPIGVNAIITHSEIDVLAHTSIRARNARVLFVSADEEVLEGGKGLTGEIVRVEIKGGQISIERGDQEESKGVEKEEEREEVKLGKIETFGNSLLIKSQDFQPGKTGNKSINCAILAMKLPEPYKVPESIAFPYGVCEYLLDLPENLNCKKDFEHEMNCLNLQNHVEVLKKLKNVIKNMAISNEIEQHIINSIDSLKFSFKNHNSHEFLDALKKVWASKFNERVFLSAIKNNIPFGDIRMCVLCQHVIQANYAFVLHTKDPIYNNSDCIYAELVLGLGETLVSSYEGRSLSFLASKSDDKFTILSFPNKSIQLRSEGIILRSDSNCEDLKGFAGAGLFDSVMVKKSEEFGILYSKESLIVDENFRRDIMKKLKEVAICVERIYDGVPQDIEGVIYDGRVYVVQSRNQV